MSGESKYHRNCICCGLPFSTNGAGAMRCPSCVSVAKAKRREKKRAEEANRKRVIKEVKVFGQKKTKCPYCGVMTFNGAFCEECLEWGNDLLYKQFGSTNGWDKPKKPEKVEAEDGWRGREIVGGFARERD